MGTCDYQAMLPALLGGACSTRSCTRSCGALDNSSFFHMRFVTKAYGLLEETGRSRDHAITSGRRKITLSLGIHTHLQAATNCHSNETQCLKGGKERTEEQNLVFVQDHNEINFGQFKTKFNLVSIQTYYELISF